MITTFTRCVRSTTTVARSARARAAARTKMRSGCRSAADAAAARRRGRARRHRPGSTREGRNRRLSVGALRKCCRALTCAMPAAPTCSAVGIDLAFARPRAAAPLRRFPGTTVVSPWRSLSLTGSHAPAQDADADIADSKAREYSRVRDRLKEGRVFGEYPTELHAPSIFRVPTSP